MTLNKLPNAVEKTFHLVGMLPRHPREVYDRILAIADYRLEGLTNDSPSYQVRAFDDVVRELEDVLGVDIQSFLAEPQNHDIEAQVRGRIEQLRLEGPFNLLHNADFSLARLAYAISRALEPSVVVETGVAYGVSTAFVLKALDVNQGGQLHSIDLPPLARDADRFVGILVPQPLKARWTLHRGPSKRVLPSLIKELRKVDFFIHNSLHTYKNVTREFDVISPVLARPSAVIADDVGHNSAFPRWVDSMDPNYWAVLRQEEKEQLFGLAVLQAAEKSTPKAAHKRGIEGMSYPVE